MEEHKASLEFVAETPIILGKKRPFKGINYSSKSYISSMTIRGAIFSSIRKTICDKSIRDCEECEEKSKCPFYNEILKGITRVSAGKYQCPACEGYNTLNRTYSTLIACKKCKIEGKKGKSNDHNYDVTEKVLESISKQNTNPKITCGNLDKNHPVALKIREKHVCLDCKHIFDGPMTEIRTNVAIEGETRAAEEEKLFFYEVVPAGVKFNVEIIGSKKGIEIIKKLKRIFLGRGKSRGFGWLKIVKNDIEDIAKPLDDLKKRLESQYEKYEVITLIAETPVVDLIHKVESNQILCYPYLEHLPGNWNLICAKGSTTKLGGWSYKSNFQKPLIFCADIGSVFMYSSSKDQSPSIDILARSLIGIKGEENMSTLLPGFNQFTIWRTK